MNPLMSAVNLTPSCTALLSPLSAAAGVAVPKRVHGQTTDGAVGVTGLDGLEAGPVPTELVAVTRNV